MSLLLKLLAGSTRTVPRHNGVPCLEWTLFTHKGYGRIRWNRKKNRVHREAYKLLCGDIPEGNGVFHYCDTPACWEPSHLWCGTQKENLDDMRAKGRAWYQREAA